MPVGSNGRWESWATRREREKAEAAVAEAATPADEPAPISAAPKRRTRRSKSAAEAAIKAATGVAVTITDEPVMDEPIEETDDNE